MTDLHDALQFVANRQPMQTLPITRGDENTLVLAVPEGMRIEDATPFLNRWLMAPRRFTGAANLKTLDSFLAHIEKYRTDDTVITANCDRNQPALFAKYNYGRDSKNPGFGDHLAKLECALSDEWKKWIGHQNTPMDQGEFASFVEDQIGDIQAKPNLDDTANLILKDVALMLGYAYAGQSDMLMLSRGITIHEDSKATAKVSMLSGERKIQYETEHKDGAGAVLTVPGLFLIAIPVFLGGVAYRLPVRLRYRIKEGLVLWSYDVYRNDKAFEKAYDEICVSVETATSMRVFRGTL